MRRVRISSVGWVLLIAVLALVGAAFRGGAFDMGIHEEITEKALSFLKADILKEIVDDSYWPDIWWSGSSEWHCDDCRFVETIKKINEWYDKTLAELDPNNFNAREAANLFGQLLHPAQDLYAHSNWVETMAAMGRGVTLFDSGIGRKWWVGGRWAEHPPGVIIAQGKELPQGWTIELKKDDKDEKGDRLVLVEVTLADGKTKKYGIISGTYGKDEAIDCHPKIAMTHDDKRIGEGFLGLGLARIEPGLNKDNSDRDHFDKAREHALKQTVHEWCRLESLVFLKYGQKGLEKLREAFVDSKQGSPCGTFCKLLSIRARDTAMNELKVKVHADVGDGWKHSADTPTEPLVVRLGQEVEVRAPPELKDKGLVFVEWKLAERRPFGATYILWPLSSSPRSEWRFRVEKCDLELIAVYGPPLEEGPVEVAPPPPGEEPPPGELPPPPGE